MRRRLTGTGGRWERYWFTADRPRCEAEHLRKNKDRLAAVVSTLEYLRIGSSAEQSALTEQFLGADENGDHSEDQHHHPRRSEDGNHVVLGLDGDRLTTHWHAAHM